MERDQDIQETMFGSFALKKCRPKHVKSFRKIFPNKLTPHFSLPLYSILFYVSLYTASLLNSFILLCSLFNWILKSHDHDLCLYYAYVFHGQSGGPTLRGGICFWWECLGGLVNEWKLIWNKTFICPLRFPKCLFLLFLGSSHLCQTFEIGCIITLQSVWFEFLCSCQGVWRASALQKGKLDQQEMGDRREPRRSVPPFSLP